MQTETAAISVPVLASALIKLRGDTLSQIAAATGIRPANLSVWLRGKPQVISAQRISVLMHYLGVQGGLLRDDVLHQWSAHGTINELKTALDFLPEDVRRAGRVYQGNDQGLGRPYYFRFDRACVKLNIEAGPLESIELDAKSLGCGQHFQVDLWLQNLADFSLDDLRKQLIEIEQFEEELITLPASGGVSIDFDSLDDVPKIAAQLKLASLLSSDDLALLDSSLSTLIARGVAPAKIISVLKSSFPD
jgi:hypothetical protein